MVIILTGAYQFFLDLNTSLKKVRAIRNPKTEKEDVLLKFFFSKATSYENDKSVGTVQFEIKDSAITDAHVLIIEDIFDTGLTMKKIVDTVNQKGAKSVKSCVLLHKKNNDNMKYFDYFSDYIGFCIPDKFVIGYGLDFNDFLRDMEHVCVISQLAIDKYKVWSINLPIICLLKYPILLVKMFVYNYFQKSFICLKQLKDLKNQTFKRA